MIGFRVRGCLRQLPFAVGLSRASRAIIAALQGQDRIEQRCQNMALAVRQFALLPAAAPLSSYEEIWSGLVLDELRLAALSGVAARGSNGDVEMF